MQTNITSQDGTAANAMSHHVEDVSNSMHHAIDRASSAAGPAIDGIAMGAHQATNRMAMTATDAAIALRSAGNRLRNAQSRLAQSCSSYVREKPMTSLGIAAAGGFLLGMVLSLTYKTPTRH